jgi:hypothetical protein
MTVTGHSRDTPDQTPNATNRATPLHEIIYQGHYALVVGANHWWTRCGLAAVMLTACGGTSPTPTQIRRAVTELGARSAV